MQTAEVGRNDCSGRLGMECLPVLVQRMWVFAHIPTSFVYIPSQTWSSYNIIAAAICFITSQKHPEFILTERGTSVQDSTKVMSSQVLIHDHCTCTLTVYLVNDREKYPVAQ